MVIAPVFIGTLNRFVHLKRVVESLRISSLSDQTHLFVGLDYPSKEEHWEGYNQISNYLNTLKGFKELTMWQRTTNMGATNNFLDGQERVLTQYDRIIISEDDNCFSPNFLVYMNLALDRFQDDPKVFGICGHNYPISIPLQNGRNYYAWQGASVWGFGTWRNRYKLMAYTKNDMREYLTSWRNMVNSYKIAPHYISSMLAKVSSRADFDPFSDAVINMHLRLTNQYCIFPTISKVRNYGHDGSGLRSGIINGLSPFADQEIDTNDCFEFQGNAEGLHGNKEINSALHSYFYRGVKQTLKTGSRLLRFYWDLIN